MNRTFDTFIALVRAAAARTGEGIDLSEVDTEALYSLARFHDLAHIVYYELKKLGAADEGDTRAKFKKQFDIASFRHVQREIALAQVRSILNAAEIPFVMLKGAVLKDLYPEPWMRTSSDIDVLVPEASFGRASQVFRENGLEFSDETTHDASFFTSEKYHVELHFSLIEDDILPHAAKVLERVWDNTDHVAGGSERTMSDEMFYFYHIVHMAKHFRLGGNGVRTILDTWLLNHSVAVDREARSALIEEGGLTEFNSYATDLAEVWFSQKEKDPRLETFEEFIVSGGVYGTVEQSVAVRKQKGNGKVSYYASRLFPPLRNLVYSYPILKKLPFLLPVFWVVRWFKLLNPKIRAAAVKEIDIENKSGEQAEKVARLIEQLGL